MGKISEKDADKTKKFPLMLVVAVVSAVLLLAVVYAQISERSYGDLSPSAQYYKPTFQSYYTSEQINTYWKIFEKEECRARQDFILNIAPGGCTPAVVRSDLLEEQPVPVFCKINAIKINPLINVESIESMSFPSQQFTKEVAGVSFHPARAAIRSRDTLLGSPLINDAGYLVVVLKRQPSEKEMPEFVEGNLTARIRYDAEKAFGIGKAEFLLPVLTDREWENNYQEYEFWRGKGFLRAEWIEPNKASISVYRDAAHKESTLSLNKGETSGEIYLGGFYCQAALQLKLKELTYPDVKAKLTIQKQGEEQVLWLYKNTNFLDNKCKVVSIEPLSLGGGSITLKCSGKEFKLSLGMANSVSLKVDNENKETKVGEIIKENNGKIYLAYVGQVPKRIAREDKERVFIVLVKTENELSEEAKARAVRRIKSVLESTREKTKDDFKKLQASLIKEEIKEAEILFYDESSKALPGIVFKGAAGSSDKTNEETNGKSLDEYFDKTISEYRKVVNLYPAEKYPNGDKTIGEAALESAIILSDILGKQKTKQELLREVIKNYPGTPLANTSEEELSKTLKYNEENAIKTVEVDIGEYYTFHLQDIVEPSEEEASASMSVEGKGVKESGIYTIGDYLVSPVETQKGTEFVQVEKLDEEYVTLKYAYTSTDSKGAQEYTGPKSEKVKLKDYTSLGKFSVYVSDIKLQRIANVVVEPGSELKGAYTETNLSFKIGIEKRAIELSPEKTQEMINNLNESIQQWEDISTKLAKVIKGWKGACYATSAVLMVKNLLDNFSGKSMARQKVMRGPGGWIEKCKGMVETGKEGYASLDDCLRQKNDEIEKEVAASQKAIEGANEMMKSTEKVTQETIFGEKILDTESSFNGYIEKFKNTAGSSTITVTDENNQQQTFTISDLIGTDYSRDYKEGIYTFSDAREWQYYNEMINNPDVSAEKKEAYKKELFNIYQRIKNRRTDIQAVSDYNKNINVGAEVESLSGKGKDYQTDKIFELNSDTAKKIAKLNYEEKNETDKEVSTYWIRAEVPAGTKDYGGKVLLIPLALSSGKYTPATDKNAYILSIVGGKETVSEEVPPSKLNELMGQLNINRFSRIEKGKCKNPYKNPEVRFYDTEPYKGMPGVVPFDEREGWYVGMKQTIKGFGLTPYTDAGLLKNFYLCNVGENGREEFDSGIGDDICTFTSFETNAQISHPCLTENEARNIAEKARSAVMEAAQQYAAGKKTINVFGKEYKVGLPVGGAEGTQCQDFMSPEDCYLLFNTCDPVLCPSSRCNLAGNYYVKDVVQSGIIGSIVLCLPNAREGIFVPVCLTGVQAGLDAYLSILKAHRDCLQESLTTGKTVGICDEIRSVYLCEFFWRQFAPLMDIALPKLVELAYGKGTRGGGEYATITHAWNTLDNSIKYFTNYYAQNSFKAFTSRSTEEAGSEVCKSFISARYPSNKKFLDALLEPESPSQYHAWFSEIPFTEATLPATSHYKVFYHIWAGNDEGVQYSVYLKDPPESSFYAASPRIIVKTGYIAKGGYASETQDFTAPAGYKTLCVRVNLQEECGFGQVSTSFAVDYLKEQYVKEQATQKITSEKDCMSGTPSIYSLAQPNIQEGVQEAISPEMYKEGIIRVCSTDNPGKQTAPTRWKDVGYCDNEKVKCWLDTHSVEANIKNNATLTEVGKGIEDISEQRIKELVEKGEIMSIEATESKLDAIKKNINSIELINIAERTESDAKTFADNVLKERKTDLEGLDDIENRGFLNTQKAKAIYLRGQLYDFIAQKIKGKFTKPATTSPATPASTEQKYTIQEINFLVNEAKTTSRVFTVNDKITIEIQHTCDKISVYEIETLWGFDKLAEDKEIGIIQGNTIELSKLDIGKHQLKLNCLDSKNNIKSSLNSDIIQITKAETTTTPATPTEPEEKFTLSDNTEILKNGESTGLSIIENRDTGEKKIMFNNQGETSIAGDVENNVLSFDYVEINRINNAKISDLATKLKGASIQGNKIILASKETASEKFTISYPTAEEGVRDILLNGEKTNLSINYNKIIFKQNGRTYIVGDYDLTTKKLSFNAVPYEVHNNEELNRLAEKLEGTTIEENEIILAKTTSEPTIAPATATITPKEKFVFELQDGNIDLWGNDRYRYKGDDIGWQISSDRGKTWKPVSQTSVTPEKEFYEKKFDGGLEYIQYWVNSYWGYGLMAYFGDEKGEKYSDLRGTNLIEFRKWINSKLDQTIGKEAYTNLSKPTFIQPVGYANEIQVYFIMINNEKSDYYLLERTNLPPFGGYDIYKYNEADKKSAKIGYIDQYYYFTSAGKDFTDANGSPVPEFLKNSEISKKGWIITLKFWE